MRFSKHQTVIVSNVVSSNLASFYEIKLQKRKTESLIRHRIQMEHVIIDMKTDEKFEITFLT